MDAIILNYDNIIGFDEDKLEPYLGPALFINGQVSVKHSDDVYKKLFPNCKIETVEGAGHYVHTDKPLSTARLIN
jgi:pimeloyl-ACP methyl ester carboxylesterase